MKTKKCGKCKKDKDLCDFHKDKRGTMGYQGRCKVCHKAAQAEWRAKYPERHRTRLKDWHNDNPGMRRHHMLMWRYGISTEDFDEMLAEQGGACAGCGGGPGKRGKFVVDHDHEDDSIRGILCHGCNVALGYVEDSPEKLIGLAKYIISHNDRTEK